MKKKTFCRKIKVLSYLIAFVIMVGVNIAMDKMGSHRESAFEAEQKAELYPERTDNNMAITSYIAVDSMYDSRAEIIVLFR